MKTEKKDGKENVNEREREIEQERERERERENRVNEWNSIVNSESIEDIINPKRTDAHWYKSTARDDLY